MAGVNGAGLEFVSFGGVHPALLASFIAAGVATLGVLLTLLYRDWARAECDAGAAFASGLVISTSVLDLFPEGVELCVYVPWLVLGGYVMLYSTGLLFRAKEEGDFTAAAPVAGIAFHSFVDGFEYPILFEHDVFSGAIATSGLILHELAEGMVVFALLRKARMRTVAAVAVALIAAALTTPVGALVSLTFATSLSDEAIGMLMSVAAGALLYVGAQHLPQHIRYRRRRSVIGLFLLGVATTSVLTITHGLESVHAH